jgi:hypothetical protein
VEDRARLAGMMKRRLGGVELDYFFGVAVFELDSQFRHRIQVVFETMRRVETGKPSCKVEAFSACIFA